MFTGYRANMLGIRHFYNKKGAATLSYLSATAPFLILMKKSDYPHILLDN